MKKVWPTDRPTDRVSYRAAQSQLKIMIIKKDWRLNPALPFLVPPLSAIFSLSFSFGHLSSAWKSANITPIHKEDAKTHPNYRPVSLLPITSKVMDSIIASDVVFPVFQQPNLRPSVWIRSISTLDMLLLLSQQWLEALNLKQEVKTISMDISQAFNTVWHPALNSKLTACGIQVCLHICIYDFLQSHSQHLLSMEPSALFSQLRLQCHRAVCWAQSCSHLDERPLRCSGKPSSFLQMSPRCVLQYSIPLRGIKQQHHSILIYKWNVFK